MGFGIRNDVSRPGSAGRTARRETFTQALATGRETAFADQYMCMTPQFEVGDASYGWLSQSLFIGRGRLAGPNWIEYQLYRVV
jgi:hypothetical protein